MRSPPVKMIICDDDIDISPNILGSSDFGRTGENLSFDWKKTSADKRGHMFKLTWYTKHTKAFKEVGNVSK